MNEYTSASVELRQTVNRVCHVCVCKRLVGNRLVVTEEATFGERNFILFKVYLGEGVRMSSPRNLMHLCSYCNKCKKTVVYTHVNGHAVSNTSKTAKIIKGDTTYQHIA